ncbi:MAG TPA: hypothetical protein VE155_07120 [Pseudonocardiaceae bacterium]|jgi:hypothetical protein|nr:hypothetical protein [Pseudonocardiaceae bacterium]
MAEEVKIDETKIDPYQLATNAVNDIGYAVVQIIAALNAETAGAWEFQTLKEHLETEAQTQICVSGLHSLQFQMTNQIVKAAVLVDNLRKSAD